MAWLRTITGTLALLFVLNTFSALAQEYPDRPIRIIAPFAAGGLVDVLAREIGQELAKSLARPVIVENKPGAGGNIGADIVANAAPDGYTLLLTSAGIQSINQFLYKTMLFNPETAFEPISIIADMPMLALVSPRTGIKSLQELIAFARENPEKLNFGSPGIGTTGHLGQALLAYDAGIQISHVAYRGASASVSDLIAGRIDGVVEDLPNVLEQVRAGSVTPLAVAAQKRLALLPDVPTSTEAGLPDWQISSWFGLVAPAGTPTKIVDRLQSGVNAALQQEAVRRFATEYGIEAAGDTADEFGRVIRGERMRWREIIRVTKIEVN
jgi:tripartite-type tricarboxylate transporter receptor subunit TctC